MSESNVAILTLELVAAVVAIGLIVTSVWLGLKGKGTMAQWRGIKFFAALVACIGFLLLLTNFDKTLRDVFVKTRELAYRDFVDLKLLVSNRVAIACVNEDESQETRNRCFDYRNIDRQLLLYNLENKKTFSLIKNWQGVPSLQPFVDEVNRQLETINREIVSSRDADGIFDTYKTDILMLALFLVAGSLAGSAGEAAYQLRLAIIAENKENVAAASATKP
jgi:hypothetical protein